MARTQTVNITNLENVSAEELAKRARANINSIGLGCSQEEEP